MGEERCIEYLNKEGYRSLENMLQGPVRARRLVDLETPDSFLVVVRIG